MHAYFWYQKARPFFTGATARQIDARLETLGPVVARHIDWGDIWTEIRLAITRKLYKQSEMCGLGSATPFEEIPTTGAMLIGLRVATLDSGRLVKGIEAIYLTPTGETPGQPFGAWDAKAKTVTLKARPGYAVGGLIVRSGSGIDAVTLRFMRIAGKRLDPNSCYDSEKIGGNGGGDRLLDGRGLPIVGLYGREFDKNFYGALGVVYMLAPDAKPPTLENPRPGQVPTANRPRP
jgi:hypothetical protein